MGDWTASQVKEHTEKILCEKERALELLAQGMRRELEHLNRLRESVISRPEYESKHQMMEVRVEKLERWPARAVGAMLLIVPTSMFVGYLISHVFGK